MMVMTRTVNAKKMEGGEMQRNEEKYRKMQRNVIFDILEPPAFRKYSTY